MPMLKPERIVCIILFSFVFIIYAISCGSTIPFWDSPEFISSNYNLQASHPPGAPFYTIFCSTILTFFSATKAALVSNLISSLFGALTVTILFKITYYITNKSINKSSEVNQKYVPYIAGIISALTLAFSTSFWVASTEAEVYTMSFAIMSAIVYTTLKWEDTTDQRKENKLILLIALLLGISCGVHLITMTVIIPLSIIFTHKKFGLNIQKTIMSLIAGTILFFSIYLFGIQVVISTSSKIDIWLVNSFNTSVNNGIIVVLLLLVILFTSTLWFTHKKEKVTVYKITLAIMFFFIGLSSYFMPIQRVQANTLIANGTETSNRLLQYIKGQQFGIERIPLLNGYSYNAPLNDDIPFIDGKPVLTYDNILEKYITVDDGKLMHVNYADEFSMLFPRVYDSKNMKRYQSWAHIVGELIEYPVLGKPQKFYKPTTKENISFFINHQLLWLNTRYLFWNFIGKQNNNQGFGHIRNGNWVSGFNFIDKHRVGDYSMMPDYFQNDKSRNTYYFLPFLLGILGLFALKKQTHYLLTTLLLFLTFGLGITIYINPLPSSILVRERDYIFIGSFVFFSLWVGLSILPIIRTLKFITSNKTKLIVVAIVVGVAAPFQLLAKGWNDHQRSYDNFAYDFGKVYLDACPEQAILITNGDNMTFPLWYLQEVEKYRTDVRVVNFDQLNLEQNIDKLKQKINTSSPLKLSLDKRTYINGADKLFPLKKEINAPAELTTLFEFLKDESTKTLWNGKLRHYIPATQFTIPVDTLKFKKNTSNINLFKASYTNSITWDFSKNFYNLSELVIMNIITNNLYERPICFAINGKTDHYVGLQEYMVQSGMVEQLAPIKRKNSSLNPKIVNTRVMYPYIMDQLKFDGLNDDTVFHSYENRSYVQDIIRRNYYFLAQALIEESRTKDAVAVLDKCVSLFPNKTIPFKQFSFALGKLYHKAGETEKGLKICQIAMQNIWDELVWNTSFNPPYPIINVQHATRLKNMYMQMRQQYPGDIDDLNINQDTIKSLEKSFLIWQKINWPY